MDTVLTVHDALCDAVTWVLLRLALAFDDYRRWVHHRARRLRGSLRKVVGSWLGRRRPLPFVQHARGPHNRTPGHVEEQVVRLHVEQPQLGAGQLMRLSERVLGFTAARETFRRILIRRRELVVELEQERRRRPRRIQVQRPGVLWGADLTLVWVLGFWPVWLLGVVDYHGSRLVAFERVGWATSRAIVRALEGAMDEHGTPERLLTDRGPVFTSLQFEALCAVRDVRHALIRPAHPWTNGRIERGVQDVQGDRARVGVALCWHAGDRPVLRGLSRLVQPRSTARGLRRSHSRRGLLRSEPTDASARTRRLLRRASALVPLRARGVI